MPLRTPIMLWMMATAALLSCAAPSQQTSETNVIGRPPAPAEDPFFVVKLPRQAEPAQASGIIGDLPVKDVDPKPAREPNTTPQTGVVSDESPTVSPPTPAVEALPPKTTLSPAKVAPPSPTPVEPMPSHVDNIDNVDNVDKAEPIASAMDTGKEKTPVDAPIEKRAKEVSRLRPPVVHQERSRPTCFSCVKICPADNIDCLNQDVICGWGRADRVADASSLALAECQGSLEMAQQMPPWKKIRGHCPTPTCTE